MGRTAPLVSPTPRTINDAGTGFSQYQQFRGPRYRPTPRQQHRTPPFYLRGSSSLTNLHSPEGSQAIQPSASVQTSSCEGSPLFVRQHDSFSNYKPRPNNNNNTNFGESVLRSNSINQSKSFNKVMADVLGSSKSEL